MKRLFVISSVLSLILLVSGCSVFDKKRKLLRLNAGIEAKVSESAAGYPEASLILSGRDSYSQSVIEDTAGQRGPIIMNAVVDDSTGELVAVDELKTIVVKADYKNIAERNGIVEVAFDITVPYVMQSKDWQIRMSPMFYWGSDSLIAEKLYVTGKEFRDRQLRGLRKYQEYFNSIVPDSSDFVKAFAALGLLDKFIERNVKRGYMGVTEQEAVDHYIRNWLVHANARKKARLEDIFRKYVKNPIESEGLRLDTVIRGTNGDLKYKYTQTLAATKGMKKIKVVFSGGVFSWNRKIYQIPSCDTLVYYVSSLARFADTSPVYLKKIVSRSVALSTSAFIDFEEGRWDVNENISNNASEIERIKENFDTVLDNVEYIADSIIICATCSPEGSYRLNSALARRRGESVKSYFSEYLSGKDRQVKILSREIPEDWERLRRLIVSDTSIHRKKELIALYDETDPDKRERLLRNDSQYKYLKDSLFPLLRRIGFTFCLSRKGMIKDTLHTTVADTLYDSGVRALQEKDYRKAIQILAPYRNINSAIAFMSMGYNYSALEILEELEKTPNVKYMTAVLLWRIGELPKAVENYSSAVSEDPSLAFRARLDPEICSLLSNMK